MINLKNEKLFDKFYVNDVDDLKRIQKEMKKKLIIGLVLITIGVLGLFVNYSSYMEFMGYAVGKTIYFLFFSMLTGLGTGVFSRGIEHVDKFDSELKSLCAENSEKSKDIEILESLLEPLHDAYSELISKHFSLQGNFGKARKRNEELKEEIKKQKNVIAYLNNKVIGCSNKNSSLFHEILMSKIAHYGNTKAAYDFAKEEYELKLKSDEHDG